MEYYLVNRLIKIALDSKNLLYYVIEWYNQIMYNKFNVNIIICIT